MKLNQLILGDCIDVLPTLPEACVDLIYLDPPYGKASATYSGPAGEFKDSWADMIILPDAKHRALIAVVEDIQGRNSRNYLSHMMARLVELHRVLKPTGSIYLHVDQKMVHSLKLAMDAIFGRGRFFGGIVWPYAGGGASGSAKNKWCRGHETILAYHKGARPNLNQQYRPYTDAELRRFNRVDEDGRRYFWISSPSMRKDRVSKNRYDGGYRVYQREGVAIVDVWDDIQSLRSSSGEKVGYPTQKPLALLRRIILASSNEGDVVLDPFCGSGTTLLAARELGREYIGIDVSADARAAFEKRLRAQQPQLKLIGGKPK